MNPLSVIKDWVHNEPFIGYFANQYVILRLKALEVNLSVSRMSSQF